MRERLRHPFLLLLLLLFVIGFRVAWLNMPEESLVFDELYYVNAARKILHLPTSGRPGEAPVYSYALDGMDPNAEHPPLAKLVMAIFITAFGKVSWSFRLPSVILGTIAVVSLYLLVKKASNSRTALFAAFLYGCENLTFIHSRIATLDVYVVSFMIIGLYFYTERRITLSALFIALSSLSKITGLFGLGVILSHSLIVELSRRDAKIAGLKRLIPLYGKYMVTFLLVFLGLLWAMDASFVLLNDRHPNPIEHLTFMVSHSLKLRVGGYLWNGKVLNPETMTVDEDSIASPPWAWLVNEKKLVYYKISAEEVADGQVFQREKAAFYGAMNPILIVSMIPSLVYLAYSFLKGRDRFSLFLIIWWHFTYVAYFPLAFMNRMLYLYYMCPVMPMVCASTALMLSRLNLPRYTILAYCSATFTAFLYSFPVTPFL